MAFPSHLFRSALAAFFSFGVTAGAPVGIISPASANRPTANSTFEYFKTLFWIMLPVLSGGIYKRTDPMNIERFHHP